MEFPIEPLSNSPIIQSQTLSNKPNQNQINNPLNSDILQAQS